MTPEDETTPVLTTIIEEFDDFLCATRTFRITAASLTDEATYDDRRKRALIEMSEGDRLRAAAREAHFIIPEDARLEASWRPWTPAPSMRQYQVGYRMTITYEELMTR